MELYVRPEAMKQINPAKMFPFNRNHIGVLHSSSVLVVLKNIRTDEGKIFQIMDLLEKEEDLFGDHKLLTERCNELNERFDTKVRRLFDGRDRFIFFDEVEQDRFHSLLELSGFTANADLYEIRKDKLRLVDLKRISFRQFAAKFQLACLDLDISVLLSPGEYIKQRVVFDNAMRDFQRPKKPKKSEAEIALQEIQKEHPEITKIQTKKEWKTFRGKIFKQHHPDTGGNQEKFEQYNKWIAILDDSVWAESLKGG